KALKLPARACRLSRRRQLQLPWRITELWKRLFHERVLPMEFLAPLFQVIMIDLVLAGDNAVVIGLAASGLPKEQRSKAILVGILAATVLRIGFAVLATQLLAIVGLLLAGGFLLLWVCWKMWRELRISAQEEAQAREALAQGMEGAEAISEG